MSFNLDKLSNYIPMYIEYGNGVADIKIYSLFYIIINLKNY